MVCKRIGAASTEARSRRTGTAGLASTPDWRFYQGVLATPLDLKLQPQQQAPAGMCAGGLAEPERTKQPGPVTRSDALLSKYRSAVKRAILIQLTRIPAQPTQKSAAGLTPMDRWNCRRVEVRPQDRLFFDAYSDAGRKHNRRNCHKQSETRLAKERVAG